MFSFSNLTLESTLQELTLYECQVESFERVSEVVQLLDQRPELPGILVTERGKTVGLLSRRRFLTKMSRPYALELYLKRSLQSFCSSTDTRFLLFSGGDRIVDAAQQSVKRSLDYLYDPVVVQLSEKEHRLLDVHQLLVAQSTIHELAQQVIREQSRNQMIQAEKMVSLGRVVANVAHEILNPVNFISGNLGYLKSYVENLLKLLELYEVSLPNPPSPVLKARDEIGIDFVRSDVGKILESLKVGAVRLKGIAESLRKFSRMDDGQLQKTDVHQCIDHALLILNSRTKNTVEIEKDYGDLVAIDCYPNQLSQVFMNILSNGIDALLERANQKMVSASVASYQNGEGSELSSKPWRPVITIRTWMKGDEEVAIAISDNGTGIPKKIQQHIFEEFFTTKPEGQGTGLGLAISYQIVTERHLGQLNLKSELGVGTEFEIFLPIHHSSPAYK
ncbi:ATP-binding protein [Leptolyngbya sp. FACHB-16]|uniref:ATP-binding protein n=1 Tax=unclassified Leptolyngbya TaxID=2650499 RepID=UPI00168921BF|nr:ATP-binding protein [Leptolyngbya sp. FACHB-8]MBD2157572.1 ATP-binding protein [Leptolyngbya sp. FACHB-16]